MFLACSSKISRSQPLCSLKNVLIEKSVLTSKGIQVMLNVYYRNFSPYCLADYYTKNASMQIQAITTLKTQYQHACSPHCFYSLVPRRSPPTHSTWREMPWRHRMGRQNGFSPSAIRWRHKNSPQGEWPRRERLGTRLCFSYVFMVQVARIWSYIETVLFDDHLNSHDLFLWTRSDIVRRNICWSLLRLKEFNLNVHRKLSPRWWISDILITYLLVMYLILKGEISCWSD